MSADPEIIMREIFATIDIAAAIAEKREINFKRAFRFLATLQNGPIKMSNAKG